MRLAAFGDRRYVYSPHIPPRPHRELISTPSDTLVLGEARKSDMGRNSHKRQWISRVQEHSPPPPESQQSSLGTECRADQDSEFASAELLQPEGHLLLSPYSISAVQNDSQATASNLSLINKTQHSQDKFLKLQSRQAASQTVGRVPFLCPSITNQPHMANSISEVPGNYSLLSSLAGRLPAQGQIRLPAASSPRRLFPSLLRDSRLLHTRSDTPGATHSAH